MDLLASNLIGSAAYQVHEHRSHLPWSYQFHGHQGFCEWCYVIDGSILHEFSTHTLRQSAGELLFIREPDQHRLSGERFRFVNLNIPTSLWQATRTFLHGEITVDALDTAEQPALFVIPLDKRQDHAAQWEDLFLCQQDTAIANATVRRFLITTLIDVVVPHQRRQMDLRPLWLRHLLEDIDGPELAKFDPGMMATQCDKSPEHLARTFRHYLNTTPSAWLNDRRLDRAALMLSHSDATIISISLHVGYENLAWFYRAFKRRFDTTPRQYRQRNTVVRP